MGAIEHDPRRAAQDFEARRPVDFREARGHVGVTDRQPEPPQLLDAGDHACSIGGLMGAEKAKRQRGPGSLARPHCDGRRLAFHVSRPIGEMDVAPQLCQWAAPLGGKMLDHVAGIRRQHAADDRPAGFENAGLLEGNPGKRITEDFRVVETDAGDDREERLADVGGVEPSAEAHFDHGEIDAAAHEVQEAKSSGQLEKGRLQRVGKGVANLGEQGREFVARNRHAVDLDPFFDGAQVGRGEQAGAISGGPQSAGEHGRGRSFSFAAGDVDNA